MLGSQVEIDGTPLPVPYLRDDESIEISVVWKNIAKP